MKLKIFFDMDGTLARFHDRAGWIDEMWRPGFFRNLEPFREMVDFANALIKSRKYEVFILSTCIGDMCAKEKLEWLKEYLPAVSLEQALMVPAGTDSKARFISPNGLDKSYILIDDYSVNLIDWESHGGMGIKCINNINNKGLKGPEFGGLSLKYNDKYLVETFENLITNKKESELKKLAFHCEYGLEKYVDSMLFDSGTKIASITCESDAHTIDIFLEVRGEVCVDFKGVRYKAPSEFPIELVNRIKKNPGRWETDDENGDISVYLDNWFEYIYQVDDFECDGILFDRDLSKCSTDDILDEMTNLCRDILERHDYI